MIIASVGTALPKNKFSQDELIETTKEIWAKHQNKTSRIEQFHKSVQIASRHLALKKEEYFELNSFTEANNAFIRVGTELGEEAIRAALKKAEIDPKEVDAIFFTTVTGLAVPTIDARLVNRLGFRKDIKRTPLFGLGCLAGAAGVARMHDYLKAYQDQVAILLSVELCSLTIQPKELSVANLIASGLFGDGASCVVGVGTENKHATKYHSTLRTLTSQSSFYYDSERVMGWDIGSEGFKIILDASVPDVVEKYVRGDVDEFLAKYKHERSDIQSWICHPGGPKVLQALEAALEVPRAEVQLTWESLNQIGNLSSSSVLFVLKETLAQRPRPKKSLAVMMAMGPGFCSEYVLLQWV